MSQSIEFEDIDNSPNSGETQTLVQLDMKGKQKDQSDMAHDKLENKKSESLSPKSGSKDKDETKDKGEEIEIPKTSHTAIMFYHFYGLHLNENNKSENKNNKCEYCSIMAIEILVILLVFASVYSISSGFGSEDVITYTKKSYSPTTEVIKFSEFFFINPYTNETTYINLTPDLFNNSNVTFGYSGKYTIEVNNYDFSDKEVYQLIFIRMCALIFLLIHLDKEYFSYLYNLIAIILSKNESKDPVALLWIVLLAIFEGGTVFFTFWSAVYTVLLGTSVFDVFANVLALTFILEVDDWAYYLIERSAPRLKQYDFKFTVNRDEFTPTGMAVMLELMESTWLHILFFTWSVFFVSLSQIEHAAKGNESGWYTTWFFVVMGEFVIIWHNMVLYYSAGYKFLVWKKN